MADPGFEIKEPFILDPTDLSANIGSFTGDFTETARVIGQWWFSGSKTYVVDIQYPQSAYTGFEITSYADIFYNRIWVIPAFIDLNGVPLTFTTEVIVWNSYFVTKSLTSIVPTNIINIGLIGPTSHTFTPLETVSYTVSLLPGAPPKVNGNFQFIFSDAEDPFLVLEGTIADIVVLPHDWNQPIIERVAYLTDVLESNSAEEQRIRLRKYPRRQYEYSIWTATNPDPFNQGVLRAYYRNKMSYGLGKTFVVPIWTDYQVLQQDILTPGTTTIPVITGNYDYFVGGFVGIMRDYINFDILPINNVNSTSLIVDAPGTSRPWRMGDTVVPIRLAEVSEDLWKGQARTDTFEIFAESWDVLVTDHLVGNRVVNNPPALIYQGYEVLYKRNEFSQDQNVEIYQTLRTLDNAVGIPKQDNRYSIGRDRTSFGVLFKDRQEFAEFLGFFDRRVGKLNPFWLPTFNNDFQVLNTGGDTVNGIDVKFIGYSQYIKQHPNKRDIMFLPKGGNPIFRRIVDSDNDPDDDSVEKITLDNALGIPFNPDTFELVCYVRWVRLDNDVLEINWESSSAARTSLSIIDDFSPP